MWTGLRGTVIIAGERWCHIAFASLLDGFLDFYLRTGNPSFASLLPTVLLRNRGGTSFVDITASSGAGHLVADGGTRQRFTDLAVNQSIVNQIGDQDGQLSPMWCVAAYSAVVIAGGLQHMMTRTRDADPLAGPGAGHAAGGVKEATV